MFPLSLTEEQIIERLAEQEYAEPDNPYPRSLLLGLRQPAAVLIPLLYHEKAWHLLLIRRTEVEGDRHSGQVAFPGGRCDADDPNPETAALREAEEEIGLKPKDVRILGRLRDFITISNYRVTPVVGVIPWPYPLSLAPEEVSRAFTIPLGWLMDAANRRVDEREVPGHSPPLSVIYFEPYDDEVLWGASARILVYFLSLLNRR